MSKLTTELKKSKVVVVVISGNDYNSKIVEITKNMSHNKMLCYVGLNKPYNITINTLKSEKVKTDNIFFIDTVSKSSKQKSADNVAFVSSPRAFTELNISLVTALEAGKIKNLIFDSLNTLLIYEDIMIASKFIHSLISKLRDLQVNVVFLALKDDKSSDLIKNLFMFVDKVIDLSE